MGRRNAFVQARKVKAGPRRRSAAPQEDLLCGERRRLRRLRRRVAAIELSCAESATVDDEAVESAGMLGQRLAEHQRAALVRGALTCGGAAVPDDVARDEPTRSRD